MPQPDGETAMPEDAIQTIDVAAMAGDLVRHVVALEGDIGVKIAASRAAADVLMHATRAAGLVAILRDQLNPPTR